MFVACDTVMNAPLTSKICEKENVRPIMPQDECHQAIATSSNVKPISVYQPVHPRQQLKSILKLRPPVVRSDTSKQAATVQAAHQDMSHQLEPLQCQDYLQGPFRTLCDSLKVQNISNIMHDISEAYSLLSARLRAEAGALLNSGEFLALRIWYDRRNELVDVVTRDVRLAFSMPESVSAKFARDHPSSASRIELTEDEVKWGRDASQLCQCAIVLVSDIFRLPALQQIFTSA